MPPVSRQFALRADVRDGFREQLDAFLGKVADGFIVAYETADGENPHIHAIFTSTKTLKANRSAFSRFCPEHKGNAAYSLKCCDDDFEAYIRYICKGKSRDSPPEIWTRQGLEFSDDVIARAHLAYYVNQDAVCANAVKRRKVEAGNVVEQVEQRCKELGLKGYERKEIAKVYISLFRDARKGINIYAAKAVVNTVACCLDGGDSAQEDLAYTISQL